MRNWNRREFLGTTLASGTAVAGLALIPQWAWSALPRRAPGDPHFFIQILLTGGADPIYFFDARPLSMTRAGLVHNYLDQEPFEWVGKNGQRALASESMRPLETHRADFSIVNGMVMSVRDDGHVQNMNVFMSGNAFGGEIFLPHLNKSPTFDLDFLHFGPTYFDATNLERVLQAAPDTIQKLPHFIGTQFPSKGFEPLKEFLIRRSDALTQGGGLFSKRVGLLGKGVRSADSIGAKFQTFPPVPPGTTDLDAQLQTIRSAFLSGVAPAALLVTPDIHDTHSKESAKNHPIAAQNDAKMIARVFEFLKNEPFDATRKMADVTTVVVTTEFARTMRQPGTPITATGTDHNPLNNFALLFGKGVRGGQVVGATDREDETAKISSAHRSLDSLDTRIMGKPFDFSREMPRADQPTAFKTSDYLQAGSVVNTLYEIFGVDRARYRKENATTGALHPVLHSLIS